MYTADTMASRALGGGGAQGGAGASPLSERRRPDTAVDAELERRFGVFVAEYRERAVGLAWRLLGGDSAAAEDVAQEAFVRAYRALGRFRGDARLSTWFYRILVNEARRHHRWRTVRLRFAGDPEPDPPAPALAGPDPALRRHIARALEALPRGQREAFVLVHLEGFTVVEAARLTGRAPGTLKSHLHRALRALRRELGGLREPAAAPSSSGSPECIESTEGRS